MSNATQSIERSIQGRALPFPIRVVEDDKGLALVVVVFDGEKQDERAFPLPEISDFVVLPGFEAVMFCAVSHANACAHMGLDVI